VALRIAQTEQFGHRQQRAIEGARAIDAALTSWAGVKGLTGGTDVHPVIADLRDSELDGKQAEDRLADIGITVNRNAVPFDPRPPIISSGVRIGTSALAARGLGEVDFADIGAVIAAALGPSFDRDRDGLVERTAAIARTYPLYPFLAS
jgi:glycine hydroxymethyltransferase